MQLGLDLFGSVKTEENSTAQKIFERMKKEYTELGPHAAHAYCCIRGDDRDAVMVLFHEGLIESRNCAANGVYDLHINVRLEIIKKIGKDKLVKKWQNTGLSEFNINHELKRLFN